MSKSINGSLKSDKVKTYINIIEEQFVSSDTTSMANTLKKSFQA